MNHQYIMKDLSRCIHKYTIKEISNICHEAYGVYENKNRVISDFSVDHRIVKGISHLISTKYYKPGMRQILFSCSKNRGIDSVINSQDRCDISLSWLISPPCDSTDD